MASYSSKLRADVCYYNGWYTDRSALLTHLMNDNGLCKALLFSSLKKRLYYRIVLRSPRWRKELLYTAASKQILKGMGCILSASITVKNQSFCRVERSISLIKGILISCELCFCEIL